MKTKMNFTVPITGNQTVCTRQAVSAFNEYKTKPTNNLRGYIIHSSGYSDY